MHSALLAWTLFLSSFSILYKYPLPISTHNIEEKEESSICSIANILFFFIFFYILCWSAQYKNTSRPTGVQCEVSADEPDFETVYRRANMTVIREWFLYIPASPPPFFLPSSSLYKIVQMCLPVFFPSSILHRDLLLLLSLWMLLLTRVAFHFGSVPATVSMKIFANFIFYFFPFAVCYVCPTASNGLLSLLAFKSYIDMAISSRR